ncbi:putative HTH-type transcriptional regulator YybR [Marinomonas gallaica]|uniref:HTH-type transcriptional regulator YybR n=1 Tax=Marinomonas gallaica TaxID=1806667 RepID=A0A1C3JRI0_9GAMM|nr:helix-turn-helix domain-containing protein [Marinomonas gallaica]SBT17804.1 putative HTH-type transcriptional regulator YybR [Marinomonas gallaica]SBT20130.1 putative HTH-type transcriptional regulator YybR [Marinomonas gallaica]
MKKITDVSSDAMAIKFDRGDVFSNKCPSREVLRHVTGRWGMLVFLALRDGEAKRFSHLRRTIQGVSEKMLAQTLQQLEADGFVTRIVYPVVPPHVEYQLTPLGIEFGQKVIDLVGWLEDNLIGILNNRQQA